VALPGPDCNYGVSTIPPGLVRRYAGRMIQRTESLARRLRDTVVRHGRTRTGRSRTTFNAAKTVEIDLIAGRVLIRGVPVELPPAGLAVVVALAVKDHPVRSDALADELYSGSDLSNAVSRLKVNVHRVKRRIGVPTIIRSENGRYALGWNVDVDFRRLATALRRLSREQTLDSEARTLLTEIRRRGQLGRPPCMFEWPWFEDVERALVDLDYQATILLANDALRGGRYDDAVLLTDEMLRADPLDEIAAEIAIRASIQNGDRLGAALHLRWYTEARRRAMSGPPPEELRRLIEQSAAV
jgi:DNA-binding SARP family transcriptional activator